MRLIILFLLLLCSNSFAQNANYSNLTKGKFTEYTTKDKNVIKIGDTIILGTPTGTNFFRFISQGNVGAANFLSGKKVVVDKLKTYGTSNSGYKMYIHFKGYGLLPVLIDYEAALASGEIENLFKNILREQALAKLKELKELRDLEVISDDEYNIAKDSLKVYILKKKN